MDIFDLIIIASAGLFAGFYGTVSGGAALLVIPLLIFVGLPIQMAIATNRFSSFGITTVGLYKYTKGKKVLYKLGFTLAIWATLGSLVGANIMLKMEEVHLQKIVAILLILISLLLIFKKDIGLKRIIQIPQQRKILGYILSFLIGIYAGFFGAAWSTFFTYILIFCFGLTFLEGAGTRKIAAIILALATSILFIIYGKVNFLYGGVLLITQAIGSYFGASFSLKKGEKFAKIIFIIVALVFGIKLLI